VRKYHPPDALNKPPFSGIKTFFQLPHVTDLQNNDIDFAVIGVPFDAGATFRTGARFGPQGIREHSMLLRPYNPGSDIAIFDYCSGIDYGDLPTIPGYIAESHSLITQSIKKVITHPLTPIFLGGDHSVSLPVLRAMADKHGPLALIHFDAHSDLWDGYYGKKDTHGTPFRRAVEEELIDPGHSIQVGLRGPLYGQEDYKMTEAVGMALLSGPELHQIGINQTIDRIRQRVGGKKAYLTFDIDFIDPAYAPGTGTPEVGGFTSYEGISLIRGLQGIDIVGFDLVEVLPAYDPAHITSLLAANLIYEFISLLAIQKRDHHD
jgi:agmatinase